MTHSPALNNLSLLKTFIHSFIHSKSKVYGASQGTCWLRVDGVLQEEKTWESEVGSEVNRNTTQGQRGCTCWVCLRLVVWPCPVPALSRSKSVLNELVADCAVANISIASLENFRLLGLYNFSSFLMLISLCAGGSLKAG